MAFVATLLFQRLMTKLVNVSKTVRLAPLTTALTPGKVKGDEGYVKVSDCLLEPTLKQLGRID